MFLAVLDLWSKGFVQNSYIEILPKKYESFKMFICTKFGLFAIIGAIVPLKTIDCSFEEVEQNLHSEAFYTNDFY